MRTSDEIRRLWEDAAAEIATAKQARRVGVAARALADTLQAAGSSLATYKATKAGVGVETLSMEDVFATEDEKALVRLAIRTSGEVGELTSAPENESLEKQVAQLATERSWSVIDTARAMLDDANATVDSLRDTATHARARRIHRAVGASIETHLAQVERQLFALDGGKPMEGAPTLLVGALIRFFTGIEIEVDHLRGALESARAQLLEQLARHRRKH